MRGLSCLTIEGRDQSWRRSSRKTTKSRAACATKRSNLKYDHVPRLATVHLANGGADIDRRCHFDLRSAGQAEHKTLQGQLKEHSASRDKSQSRQQMLQQKKEAAALKLREVGTVPSEAANYLKHSLSKVSCAIVGRRSRHAGSSTNHAL